MGCTCVQYKMTKTLRLTLSLGRVEEMGTQKDCSKDKPWFPASQRETLTAAEHTDDPTWDNTQNISMSDMLKQEKVHNIYQKLSRQQFKQISFVKR